MVFSHGLFSNSEEITATKLSAFSSEKVCTDSWHRWNNPPATVKIIFHGANTVWCLWKDIISILYLQYAKYLLYKLIFTCQMTGEMLLLTRQKENEMKIVKRTHCDMAQWFITPHFKTSVSTFYLPTVLVFLVPEVEGFLINYRNLTVWLELFILYQTFPRWLLYHMPPLSVWSKRRSYCCVFQRMFDSFHQLKSRMRIPFTLLQCVVHMAKPTLLI